MLLVTDAVYAELAFGHYWPGKAFQPTTGVLYSFSPKVESEPSKI